MSKNTNTTARMRSPHVDRKRTPTAKRATLARRQARQAKYTIQGRS